MNISQTSSGNILDVQNQNRDNVRHKGGTSIQQIFPVQKSSDTVAKDPNVDGTGSETSFDTIMSTLVDTLNPLQHIPGVSSAYQGLTGDKQNPVASMAGGFLFGGPVGLIAGAANSFIEMVTGKSLGQHAMNLISGDAGKRQPSDPTVTSQIGDGTPMLQEDPGKGLQEYQTFATATAKTKLGFGADASTVAWASNTWTTQALQQATGAYDAAQNPKSDHVGKSSKFS
ncbi:MAG: hypothetical protein JKY92_04725 [Magnetovibrio sp.]|nr:hypothetical protein [Magnetovibrio sp.]